MNRWSAPRERLVAAHILAEDATGDLVTTDRWRAAMMRSVRGLMASEDAERGPEVPIIHSLFAFFPEAGLDELVDLAAVMLSVEAHEAGLDLTIGPATPPAP